MNALLFIIVLLVGSTVSFVRAEDQYPYRVSKDNNKQVCSHVIDILNRDRKKYGRGFHPEKFQDPIFKAINWTTTKSYPEFDYYGQIARFDIDNNGQVDLVVKEERSGGRDVTFMRLFILDNVKTSEVPSKWTALSGGAVGSVDVGFAYIYPFVLERMAYLLVSDSPDSTGFYMQFAVYKYRGGKVGSEGTAELEMSCLIGH